MAAGGVNLGNSCGAYMKSQGYPESGLKCSATIGIASIASLALFIIGCIGAAGAFPGSAIGWVVVGLAAGGFALNLAAGNLKMRKIELIAAGLAAAIFVTLGALGGIGILTAQQVGYGVLTTVLCAVVVNCIVGKIKQRQTQPQVNALIGQNLRDILRQQFIKEAGGQHTVLIDQFLEEKKDDITNFPNLSITQQLELPKRLNLQLTQRLFSQEVRREFIEKVGAEHAQLIDQVLEENKGAIESMLNFEENEQLQFVEQFGQQVAHRLFNQTLRQKFIKDVGEQHTRLIDRFLEEKKDNITSLPNLNEIERKKLIAQLNEELAQRVRDVQEINL